MPADGVIELPQIAALRRYVNREEHADHDTFAIGREFAEILLASIDGDTAEIVKLHSENRRLREAITDIDAHATALGEDGDGFVTGGYTISIGSLHRALALTSTAVPCRECTPESHDCLTANQMWSAMQRACNHPERWREILGAVLDATRAQS